VSCSRSAKLAAILLWPLIVGWTGDAQAQNASAADTRASERGPKTLFEWTLGNSWENTRPDTSQEQDRIDPDRPHFPESSTTVGKGRTVLESGYTLTKKGPMFVSHSDPEALLRVGMFADWFEFRIGQNFLDQRQTIEDVTTNTRGAQDLYVGMKLGLTEQRGILPQVAILPQMTLPTGAKELTAGRVLPGVNVDMGWDVIKDFFGVELLIANNYIQDDMQNKGFQVATGLTGVFQLTKKLEAFAEWDAFYATGPISSFGPQHYALGGLVYFITNNLAVDARAGIGLNGHSNRFLAGAGFAMRF
jgi:outer membrane putative beta-barrel porin/alpha-amylase